MVSSQTPSWSPSTPFADVYHNLQFIDVTGSNSQNGLNNTSSQVIKTEIGETHILSFF